MMLMTKRNHQKGQ